MGQAIIAASNGAGFLLFLVVAAFFYVLFALPVWGTYQKASPQGEPAWAAFVPVYSFIILLRVAGRPAWWAWFLLLPLFPYLGTIALLVLSIIVLNDVSKGFGHGGGFTVGLVLLPIVFWFILWLGSSTYRGPQGPTAMAGGYGGYPNQGFPPSGGYAQPGYPSTATSSRAIRSRATSSRPIRSRAGTLPLPPAARCRLSAPAPAPASR